MKLRLADLKHVLRRSVEPTVVLTHSAYFSERPLLFLSALFIVKRF
jgi:hypothetical protein